MRNQTNYFVVANTATGIHVYSYRTKQVAQFIFNGFRFRLRHGSPENIKSVSLANKDGEVLTYAN